jgi:hypothetical protein
LEGGEESQILDILMEMKEYYPNINIWSKKIIRRIKLKHSICKIGTWKNQIISLAIMTLKEPSVIKLNTFYILKPHQKTFSFGQILIPFFTHFGFQIDGIAPNRYKKNKFEIILGKTMIYKEISENEFLDFIKLNLFQNRGFKLVGEYNQDLVYIPSYDILNFVNKGKNLKTIVRINSETNPNAKDVLDFNNVYSDSFYNKIYISYYGFDIPCKRSENLYILDAYDIETLFYPIILNFSGGKQKDVIIPLSSSWIKKNLPPTLQYNSSNKLKQKEPKINSEKEIQLLNNKFNDINPIQMKIFPLKQVEPVGISSPAYVVPSRFQNRNEKIILRDSQIIPEGIKRGSHIILYNIENKEMFGYAKLIKIKIGSPTELYEHYSGRTILTLNEFENIASFVRYGKEKKIMSLEIEWYNEFHKKVSIKEISRIDEKRLSISKNTFYPIDCNKYNEIIKKAMNE